MHGRTPDSLPRITPRQLQVVRLVAAGLTNEAIARELGISHDGAKYHVSELLGRLGLSSREEIAAWYAAYSDDSVQPPRHRRLRAALALPAAWIAGGVAAVVAVLLLMIAFDGAQDSGPVPAPETDPVVVERGAAANVETETYDHHHAGVGWESSAVADIGERDLVFLGYPDRVLALDANSGTQVGEVAVPRGEPLIVRRGTDQQLIVSTMTRFATDEGGDSVELPPQVLIFDIASGFALHAVASLPRDRGPVFRQPLLDPGALTVSRDERYLYSIGRTDTVEVFDLDDDVRWVSDATLAERCAGVSLSPFGDSSVIAHCGWNDAAPAASGTVSTIDPAGDVEVIAVEDDLASSAGPLPPGGAIFAALESARGFAVVYLDGAYDVFDGTRPEVEAVLLAEDEVAYPFASGGAVELGDSRLVIAYYSETPAAPTTPASGLVVVDRDTGRVEQRFEIEHLGMYPVSESEVALLGDSRIDLLDLSTLDLSLSIDTGGFGAGDQLPLVR